MSPDAVLLLMFVGGFMILLALLGSIQERHERRVSRKSLPTGSHPGSGHPPLAARSIDRAELQVWWNHRKQAEMDRAIADLGIRIEDPEATPRGSHR